MVVPHKSELTPLSLIPWIMFACFDQNNKPGLQHTLYNKQALSTPKMAHKAAEPNMVSGRTLSPCTGQLAEVFSNIFNLSL